MSSTERASEGIRIALGNTEDHPTVWGGRGRGREERGGEGGRREGGETELEDKRGGRVGR